MARNRILLISLFPILLIFMNSCRERASEVPFRTVFVSKDSLTEYSLDIYVRAVKNELINQKNLNIPIEIVITSPSGVTYTDAQNLLFDKAENRHVGRWVDFIWRYREGVRFIENGEWQLAISYRSGARIMREVGIVIK